MFPHISLPEIIVIGILAIIFFGKDKLPEAAASFGKAFKSFKKEIAEVKESISLEEKKVETEIEPKTHTSVTTA